jgi:hypothetical protein
MAFNYGQYIKVSDTESTFNTQLQNVFDSPLRQTHAFVEKAYKIDKPSNFVNLNQDYNRQFYKKFNMSILNHKHYFQLI